MARPSALVRRGLTWAGALLVLGGCAAGVSGGPVTPSHAPEISAPTGINSRAFKQGTVEVTTDAGSAIAIDVEFADTPGSRAIGLMHRQSLAPDVGMLLLYPEPVDARLWMKDTTIALSAAGFDAEGRIVWLEHLEPCPADPCRHYVTPLPVVGILEVNRHAFDAWGIAIGDSLRILEP